MNTSIALAKANSLKTLLENNKKNIEAALPRHLTPDRMLKIAMTEARNNPALLDCTQSSFIGAIIQCSQLGLEPGSILGHAYLVPFNNKKAGTKEVQFIIGYRGMIDLAGRSQRCSNVIARAVYAMDEFDYEFGLNERLVHKPVSDKANTVLTHVYAIITMKDGGKIFDVMNYGEIIDARSRSKSADYGPWSTDFEAMAKKSIVRRLFKYAPVSIEIQHAVGHDEAADRGEQNNSAVIDAEGKTVHEESPVNQIADSLKKEKPNTKKQPTKEEPAVEVSKEFADMPDPRSRSDVSKSIMGLIRALGVDISELEKMSLEKFKVSLKECTLENLEKLESILNEQMKGK